MSKAVLVDYDFDKEKVSELVRRALNGRTQQSFAQFIGVTPQYINKIIRKKLNNPPTPKLLIKIAKASDGTVSSFELLKVAGYEPARHRLHTELVIDTLYDTIVKDYDVIMRDNSVEVDDLVVRYLALAFSTSIYRNSLIEDIHSNDTELKKQAGLETSDFKGIPNVLMKELNKDIHNRMYELLKLLLCSSSNINIEELTEYISWSVAENVNHWDAAQDTHVLFNDEFRDSINYKF